MTRLVLLGWAGLFCCAQLGAQAPYVIVESVRLPAESFVGDPVELRYTIRTDADAAVPDDIPQPRWGTIDAVRLVPQAGGFSLRLTATPYEPGTLTLPPIDLGSVRVDGLSLLVLSILAPGDTVLRASHGPVELPGTRSRLFFLGFGFAVLLAIALYFFGPGRRHIHALVSRYRAKVPYRRLLLRVQTLERDIQRHTMRDFYIMLMESLQQFMDSRLDRNCMAATSTELIRYLPELDRACGAVSGTSDSLEEIIRAADAVKFARLTIRRKKRLRHLVVVHAVAVELESHRRRLRRRHRQVPEAQNVGV